MPQRDKEGVPYLSSAAENLSGLVPDKKVSVDEAEFSTLRQVYLTFKQALDELDKWHAFDLNESELSIKQQIKAHKIAYDILDPLFSEMESAIKIINAKYEEK